MFVEADDANFKLIVFSNFCKNIRIKLSLPLSVNPYIPTYSWSCIQTTVPNFEFNLLIHLLTTKLVLFVSFKLITYTHVEHDYEIWNFVHITLYDYMNTVVGMLKHNHLMKEKKNMKFYEWNEFTCNNMNFHVCKIFLLRRMIFIEKLAQYRGNFHARL